MRFEVDACKEETAQIVPAPALRQPGDMLADALSSLSLTSSTSPPIRPIQSRDGLDVIRGGHDVPQGSLIKIKTRSNSSSGGFPGAPQYLQLMFGQTPALYVGIHQNGRFTTIRECQLDEMESSFSAKVQPGLKKLSRLLEEIRDIALERGRGAQLSLVYQKKVSPDLQVMERSRGKSLLPDNVLRRFAA